MTLEIVVELQSSCETVKGARVPQKHTMTAAAAAVVLMVVESWDPLRPVLIKTHPHIEVDLLDDTTAVVQVQTQLVQAQSFL